ncbi:MAG: transporter, partial [Candidatus Binatia bacterium]
MRTMWRTVLAAITLVILARVPASADESNDALAKATQNPVAYLISVPFQNNFNFKTGPNDKAVWVLNVQPVIPITLNENWNLITRTI